MIDLYLRLLAKLRTPLVFFLDTKYKKGTSHQLRLLLDDFHSHMLREHYIPEYYDCDDFAWELKAYANKQKYNWVGFVAGWHGGFHCWNVSILEDTIEMIEPQNRQVVSKGYHPIVVIV